jgi:Mg/Co/Ni transporter MgtE
MQYLKRGYIKTYDENGNLISKVRADEVIEVVEQKDEELAESGNE